MDRWTMVLVVLAATALLLTLGGFWWDRRRARQRRHLLASPPARDIPGFQPVEVVPEYLTELEARQPSADLDQLRLSSSELTELRQQLDGAWSLPAGAISEVFITEPELGWAVARSPLVLVCGEPIQLLRELYPVLEETMPRGRPLVVVTPEIDGVVLDALEVNHLRGNLVAIVVVAPIEQVDRAAELVGAAVSSRHDLLAGYLPRESLGECAWWVSGPKESWVIVDAQE